MRQTALNSLLNGLCSLGRYTLSDWIFPPSRLLARETILEKLEKVNRYCGDNKKEMSDSQKQAEIGCYNVAKEWL